MLFRGAPRAPRRAADPYLSRGVSSPAGPAPNPSAMLARKLRCRHVMTTTFDEPASASARRRAVLAPIGRVLDYLFGLLYALLAIRLVLELIDARKSAGFVGFIVAATSAFYAPFKGIVASDNLDGAHPIVWPIVIAIAAYMLLHIAIRRLLLLVARA